MAPPALTDTREPSAATAELVPPPPALGADAPHRFAGADVGVRVDGWWPGSGRRKPGWSCRHPLRLQLHPHVLIEELRGLLKGTLGDVISFQISDLEN